MRDSSPVDIKSLSERHNAHIVSHFDGFQVTDEIPAIKLPLKKHSRVRNALRDVYGFAIHAASCDCVVEENAERMSTWLKANGDDKTLEFLSNNFLIHVLFQRLNREAVKGHFHRSCGLVFKSNRESDQPFGEYIHCIAKNNGVEIPQPINLACFIFDFVSDELTLYYSK